MRKNNFNTMARFALAAALAFLTVPSPAQDAPPQAVEHKEITSDGAWCWFADPRAVRYNGKTYLGWVNKRGDVAAAAFDEASEKVDTIVLKERLNRDDHANPALLFNPEGRVLYFYSGHGGNVMYTRRSARPADLSAFEPVLEIKVNTPGRFGYTYPNPFLIPGENKIFLFWRGGDFQPNFSVSRDGRAWEAVRTFIKGGQRPYVKYETDGRNTVHFAFTDGHPRNEAQNSIYYACYREGAFFGADGRHIKSLEALPLTPAEADLVYHARANKARAWIWDLALDAHDRPVIVYAVFPEETRHFYRYARWDGAVWRDNEIVFAGKWFPQTPAGKTEPEPHYAGGIALDHDNPDVVVLSRQIDGVFEIERWVTGDPGKTWRSEAVTKNSTYDNVRPVVARHRPEGKPALVLWMRNKRYVHYTDFDTAILAAFLP